MAVQANVLGIAALAAIILLAIPLGLVVREMSTGMARDTGSTMLLTVYVVLMLGAGYLFLVWITA